MAIAVWQDGHRNSSVILGLIPSLCAKLTPGVVRLPRDWFQDKSLILNLLVFMLFHYYSNNYGSLSLLTRGRLFILSDIHICHVCK